MDNQKPAGDPSGGQTSASLDMSMPNAGQTKMDESKSQANFQQQQQQQQQAQQQQQQQPQQPQPQPPGPNTNAQAPNQYNYAPPIQINVNSPSGPQQQMAAKMGQQNLSSSVYSPIQSNQQQQPQQQELQSPQMPPQHTPIKPLLVDESSITIPPTNQSQKQESMSPQKAVITKVRLSDELNIFDWFRTKEIINQIAERAKSSVDSVITTLDPGMKEYLYSGGNVNIVVISDSECQISPVRDAFQSVFGRATVTAAPRDTTSMTSAMVYPIRTACGLQEATLVAQARIKKLRQDTNSVPQNQVIVAIQPTLISMTITSNEITKGSSGINGGDTKTESTMLKWFYTFCILIEDPVLGVTLNCYSQFIPIDTDIVESARAIQLPADFTDKHLGFAGTIDELMAYKLRLNPSNGFSDEYGSLWLREWAGLYETQIVHQLSLTLAQSYRRKWNDCARLDAIS